MSIEWDGVVVEVGELVVEGGSGSEVEGPTRRELLPWDRTLMSVYDLVVPGDSEEERREVARTIARLCCEGTAGLVSTARPVVEVLRRSGKSLDPGFDAETPLPLYETLLGESPERAEDLEVGLSYAERELASSISELPRSHFPEGYESVAMHADTVGLLAMEVADATLSTLMEVPEPDGVFEVGTDDLPRRPTVLLVGHLPLLGRIITEELGKLAKQVELVGLTHTAWPDREDGVRVVGPLSMYREYVSSGFADVVVVDGTCPGEDVVEAALEGGSKLIATVGTRAADLPDVTDYPVEEAVEALVTEEDAVYVDEPVKAVEIAAWTALRVEGSRDRGEPPRRTFRVSPPTRLTDVVIRNAGVPVVAGNIPSIIVLVSCPENLSDVEEPAKIAEVLLKRGPLVLVPGCLAVALGSYSDEEGKTLYERYPDTLLNTGPCTSAAHLVGACVRVGMISGKLPIRGKFVRVADYVLNRVGACVVAWGGEYPEHLVSAAYGVTRWGIPVILGPDPEAGSLLIEKDPRVIDARSGEEVEEHTPKHLRCVVSDWKEAAVTAARLCMRPNDTPEGRQNKVEAYVELYRELYGELPPDLDTLIRDESDIPVTLRSEIRELLEEAGWRPGSRASDPTLLSEG
ncbi:hypothetical protein [Methanopyrus sp.]